MSKEYIYKINVEKGSVKLPFYIEKSFTKIKLQSNKNDGGIHLNIENFNNNRNIDVKTLYEELEYYKYQSKLARGGV